jgi:hypothetical protein
MEDTLVIACSFRSFTKTNNDLIQRKFIESLKFQNTPVHLVVTQFGEFGVEEELKEISHTYIDMGKIGWSHSKVFSNAQEKFPTNNIVWCTVDIEFPKEMANVVQNALTTRDFCTSWPYLWRDSVEQVATINTVGGLDFIAISRNITKHCADNCEKYKNVYWGLFECQLTAYASTGSNKFRGRNLYNKIKIIKTTNLKEAIQPANYILRAQFNENLKKWNPWLQERKLRQAWVSFNWCMLHYSRTPIRLNIFLIAGLMVELKSRIRKYLI